MFGEKSQLHARSQEIDFQTKFVTEKIHVLGLQIMIIQKKLV